MTKRYAMPLTVFLATMVMCVAASAQPLSFTLVYQRMQMQGAAMSPKTIRTNASDSYLVLANESPDMLLRSYDKGTWFELAAAPEDYVRVSIWPALFLWPNVKGAIFGAEGAKTIGNTALSSGDKYMDFTRSDNWQGPGAIGPIKTFDAGLAITSSEYTTDYGRTWNPDIMGAQRDKCYSTRFGLLVSDRDGSWHRLDPGTGTVEALPMIPSKYTIVRSTPGGTTIGFTETSIGWMGPKDTTFTERDRFVVPGTTQAIPMTILTSYRHVTWRDTTVMCLATTGANWYLLHVGERDVQTIHLEPLKQGNKFSMVNIDEPGCLIGEQNSYGHVQRYILFNQDGKIVSYPAIHKATGSADATAIAWSDSATYVYEGTPVIAGHLFRIDHRKPDRLEHVGRGVRGENVDFKPMGVCVLDTLNGRLIGRDIGGALMEYTNDSSMRGFLIKGGISLLDRTRTTAQNFEFSKPHLITSDTAFVIGTTSAYIGSTNAGSLGWIWNEQNPLTMLQRSATGSFYFGRQDVIQASLNGVPIDTIPVVLPGEQRDRVGVLSDIAEVNDQRLVVALRGHNTRTYTGDLLASVRGGIAYTTDRGQTWQRSIVPSEDQAYYSMQRLQSGAMLSVSVDADILVDSASSTSEARCYGGHILRSTDGGITWTAQATFSLRNELLTLCSYKIWQGSTGRIYVATPEAVFISIDDGMSFTAVNEFPLNCTINGVAEYNGQLHVATTLGIYRENTVTSVSGQDAVQSAAIYATASRNGQSWRITVTGLPTSRIMGIDFVDLQGRHLTTADLWAQDGTASITAAPQSSGIYGIVVRGAEGQRWTTAVGIIE